MTMRKKNTLLFFFCTLLIQSYAQKFPHVVHGKCYAKYSNTEENSLVETFAMYLGDKDKMIEGVEEYTILIVPNQTIKEQKGVKAISYTSKSEDCFLWETIESSDEKFVTFWIVTDTNVVKNFKMTTIKITKTEEIEWIEVLCDEKTTPKIIEEIRTKLMALGYYCGEQKGSITPYLKTAIKKYQIKNSLHLGLLNIETLNHLKINYKVDRE
jgi:hypothetical protein